MENGGDWRPRGREVEGKEERGREGTSFPDPQRQPWEEPLRLQAWDLDTGPPCWTHVSCVSASDLLPPFSHGLMSSSLHSTGI